MHCKQWIFDMDGTLTDSMTVVWEGAPDALLRRYGRTPRGDLRATLLNMGMLEGAQYLIREYDLPLTEESYFSVMREVIAELYETVELKPGVRTIYAVNVLCASDVTESSEYVIFSADRSDDRLYLFCSHRFSCDICRGF